MTFPHRLPFFRREAQQCRSAEVEACRQLEAERRRGSDGERSLQQQVHQMTADLAVAKVGGVRSTGCSHAFCRALFDLYFENIRLRYILV